MIRKLVTASVTLLVLTGLSAAVIRPLVKTAREALSDSFQDLEGVGERWQDLGAPDSFVEPVESLPETSERVLDLPEKMLEELTLLTSQDGETLVENYLGMLEGGSVETTASTGNRVVLIPVARRWETEGEADGCSSKFEITKADPWKRDDHFHVTVQLIDREGEQTASYTNYMSPEFMTEWIVDVEEYPELAVPWCGSAVIAVHDDISDPPDLLSQKYQVQVEVLTFCDCLKRN